MSSGEAWTLKVDNLSTSFRTRAGDLAAVRDVSFAIAPGETLALVGESGSGKSVTAASIMRLLPKEGRIIGGRSMLNGKDLLGLSEAQMEDIRGKELSQIFQDPMTSLNPVHRIGPQIAETLVRHEGMDRSRAREAALDLLRLARIADPERVAAEYPHRLSGGMRQRVMIAIAIACNPSVLLADEPTTALDVTIQAQILKLLDDLRRQRGMSMLLITHDLGLVAEYADQIAVMYAGKIVEQGTTIDFFRKPLHPYSRGLLAARPALEGGLHFRQSPLAEMPGALPNMIEPPPGCAFAARCPIAVSACSTTAQALRPAGSNHAVACMRVESGELLPS
jgi:peptide/nickel transport system ATP-binding protein